MPGELFYWLFNMSLTAIVTGTVVMLIRQVRRIPRRITVLLWFAPFLRMIFPFGMSNPWSLMSLLSQLTTKSIPVFQIPDGPYFTAVNHIMAADQYFPLVYKAHFLEGIFSIASILWLLGAAAVLTGLSFLYISGLQSSRKARHLRGNIYLSAAVRTPTVYGILRPRILLPEAGTCRHMDLVLLHETVHIRRGDNFWRLAAFAITAIHWFNPFAWLFLRLLLTDLELACDECVLASCGPERKKDYAHTLLDAHSPVPLFPSAFTGTHSRRRIENILSFRKLTFLSGLGFFVLISLIVFTLLTNAG